MCQQTADTLPCVMPPPSVLVDGSSRSGKPQREDLVFWFQCVLCGTLQRNLGCSVAVLRPHYGSANGGSKLSERRNVDIRAFTSKERALHGLDHKQVLRGHEADG